MDKIDLSGKVAIITGACSGIGAETAVAFARFGAKLSLVGSDEAKLSETVEKCASINNVVLWMPLDVAHPGVCERVVNETVERCGRLDILVNCAEKIAISHLCDNSMETFDDLMNTNFRVPYHLTQLALPHLVKTKGNIINVGSSMSKRSKPGLLAYTVSKAALQMFSKQAAFELAPQGVRMNSICPGPITTNVLPNIYKHELQEQMFSDTNQSPSDGKIMDPKEIALLICLTASDAFPSLNGSDILFDGAALMA